MNTYPKLYPYDVVGYTFTGSIFCNSHVGDVERLDTDGNTPKIIFRDQLEQVENCEACGIELS